MNTDQIYRILAGLFCKNKITFDVCACDELDELVLEHYPIAIVINNRPTSHPGEHWTCMFIENRNLPINFFCSYGVGVDAYASNFREFIEQHGTGAIQNCVQLQSPNSNVCGHYSIWFLWKRVNGFSVRNVYSNFSKDYSKNDRLVKEFINNKIHLLNQKCCNKKIHQNSINFVRN